MSFSNSTQLLCMTAHSETLHIKYRCTVANYPIDMEHGMVDESCTKNPLKFLKDSASGISSRITALERTGRTVYSRISKIISSVIFTSYFFEATF